MMVSYQSSQDTTKKRQLYFDALRTLSHVFTAQTLACYRYHTATATTAIYTAYRYRMGDPVKLV